MTDDFVKENFKVDSLDAMKEEVISYLQNAADYNRSQDTYDAIQNWLVDHCEVEVPQDYLEARVGEYQANFVAQNCSDGTNLEDYLNTNYGYTVDQAVEKWTDYMTENIKLEFILEAIAQKEKIEIDEDEYASYIQNLISNSSSTSSKTFEDEDALYEFYGSGHKDEGEAYLRKIYLANLALDQLKENANVTEAPATDESTEATEAVEDTEAVESTEE